MIPILERFLKVTLLALLIPFINPAPALAAPAVSCAVYFTGVGCPHCAKTDPVVLGKLLVEQPNVVIVEYEIYQESGHAPLISQFNDVYGSPLGVPLLVFGKDRFLVGDSGILKGVGELAGLFSGNPCPQADGSATPFEALDLSTLPGKPKFWSRDRVLIRVDGNAASKEMVARLRELLIAENIDASLKDLAAESTTPQEIALSGSAAQFSNAVLIGGFLFQWGRLPVGGAALGTQKAPADKNTLPTGGLTLPKILSLALVDAINPCALAVLALMLLTVFRYHPGDRRKVLWSGLAFCAAVFVTYFVYGLLIVRFFQVFQLMSAVRLWLYRGLGFFGIVLGVLNLRDFFAYRPGGLGTEMPLVFRGRVGKLISKVTGVRGAAFLGALVTVFLLPCTIGPYVICGGILSPLSLWRAVPWLALYNAVFVLPMVLITWFCYVGATTAERVSIWKDRNIRVLHLVEGLLMLGLGAAMLFGLV